MARFYICALITAASAFTSLGFSVQTVRSANNEQVGTLYAAARSFALAIVCLITFFYHSKPFLVAVASIMIVIQVLDSGIGFKLKSRLKTYGPIITATFNLLALIWLLN